MPPIGRKEDQTEDQQKLVEFGVSRHGAADKLHRQYRGRWDSFYALYRSYKKAVSGFAQARTENDRDIVRSELRREFGEELFVPFCFSTVETVLPRVISNDPRMLALPLSPEAEKSIKPVEQQFARDQSAINYAMKLQNVARSGLINGLGVGMTYWDCLYRNSRTRTKRMFLPGDKVQDKKKLVYEGPGFEAVDIYDWFWDPGARDDMASCGWAIFRSWRNGEYVADKVKSGEWAELDLEVVKGLASDKDRGEMWANRLEAGGISNPGASELHEIWQYHDRERVITILDRELVVQEGTNPHDHGDLPFQIYRPTPVPSEFVGIGEIEPIAHLQYELNQMRGQRRDAATLALKRGYFYQRGALQPKDFTTGPDALVPTNFDPREAIFPMPIADIPSSSVTEEEALKADIVLTSGISEAVSGTNQPTSSDTATGIQLVQAQADLRIKQKSKNLTTELVKPGAAQWLELYRQKIRKERTIRIDDHTRPSGYAFIKIGPDDFKAELEMTPEGGSQEADNKTQKLADAIQFTQALAPFVEEIKPEKMAEYLLEAGGIDQPAAWLKSDAEKDEDQVAEQGGAPPQEEAPGSDLPNAIGEAMVQAGLGEDQAEETLQAAAKVADPADPEAFTDAVFKTLTDQGMDPEDATSILELAAQAGQEPPPEQEQPPQ